MVSLGIPRTAYAVGRPCGARRLVLLGMAAGDVLGPPVVEVGLRGSSSAPTRTNSKGDALLEDVILTCGDPIKLLVALERPRRWGSGTCSCASRSPRRRSGVQTTFENISRWRSTCRYADVDTRFANAVTVVRVELSTDG